jgi:hypothetical protein
MSSRLWYGLLLSIVAVASYAVFFYRFPVTRDIPWVNLLLFAAAIYLLISGFRRSRRKVWAGIVTAVGLLLFVGFGLGVTVGSRVPQSPSAPQVGQRAPDFTLLDSAGRKVALQDLLGSAPRGVLLVFYRGYW